MAKEPINGKMDRNIKDHTQKEKNKAKEFLLILQVKNMLECGLMESNKVKAKLLPLQVKFIKTDSGRKVDSNNHYNKIKSKDKYPQ